MFHALQLIGRLGSFSKCWAMILHTLGVLEGPRSLSRRAPQFRLLDTDVAGNFVRQIHVIRAWILPPTPPPT